MKKFTEVSLSRRRAELSRARSDRTPTCRGMLFAVVTDKLDLYSAERRLEKEKCNFFCVLYNKSMYVMRLQDFNGSRQLLSATVHLSFYFTSSFPCFTRVSEGYFMPCYKEKWKL